MSKFFFKGRKEKKPKHESYGFNTKRVTRPGSQSSPLSLSVASEQRKAEVAAIVEQHALFADIAINADAPENLSELEGLLDTPKTIVLPATPARNEPCSCGSGKKYKKCCG